MYITSKCISKILYNEQIDEELDEMISRIKLEEGNTEFWRRRFLGEGLNGDSEKSVDVVESEPLDVLDDIDEDVAIEVEDEEADEEEEEVEQPDNQVGERAKEKEAEASKPLQMIGVQLLKDSDMITRTSRKSRRRRTSRTSVEVCKLMVASVLFFISLHL